MKTILFSISLLTLTTGFAQEKEQEPSSSEKSKLTFGWIYSPEVSYRFLFEGAEADQFTPADIEIRNNTERAKFGQTFSFFWGYELSKTFTLEGGLGYTDFGEGREPTDIYISNPSPEYYATITGSNHIHVVNLPISMHMNLGGKRVQGFISAGISPGFMMRYTTYSKTEFLSGSTSTSNNYSVNAQMGFNNFILGAHFSGGVDIRYSDKASLRIAPVFRLTTNNVYGPDPIGGNYFNTGIEFGTIYRL